MTLGLGPETIQQAAHLLQNGGVVALPTETVYGLGANALNPAAVARVFAIKQRPSFDPLIVHVPDAEAAFALSAQVPEVALQLSDAFWPGPLTLVLKKQSTVPDLVTSGLDTVALRVPSHPVMQQVLRKSGLPIAAPSANPFGKTSPTTAEHVRYALGDAVDLIVDGGPCATGVESTVVHCSEEPVILRPGGVPREAIEQIIGPCPLVNELISELVHDTPDAASPATPSPGMLAQHYAPDTPLHRVSELPDPLPSGSGVLSLLPMELPGAEVEVLSPTGDLNEAAANLFAAMHRLDALGRVGTVTQIFAVAVPEKGLGAAINDRLRRAGTR